MGGTFTIMDFQPNPEISLERNLANLAEQLAKRPFKSVFMGILAPLYPIAWLVDLPGRRKDRKVAVEAVIQRLSNPIYIVDWEIQKVDKLIHQTTSELAELEAIASDFRASLASNPHHLLGAEGQHRLQERESELKTRVNLQQTKLQFFHRYSHSLNLVKAYFETGEKLEDFHTTEKDLVEMLLFQQKSQEIASGLFVNLRPLSSEMAQCQAQDKAEVLMDLLGKIAQPR